jgi:hypothetical protein
MLISQSAFDLIVAEEVSSKAYYIKNYQHPEWPQGASGVTVGIGYDLGYASPAKITADFGQYVPADMLTQMIRCSGVTGGRAASLLGAVKSSIIIPWDVAIKVFAERDVPQWSAQVLRSCPGADKMNSTCFGVIVSIAYNRGAGGFNSSSDRNREMREIKEAIATGNFAQIPTLIRSMARLWPGVSGLQGRRRREAALFEKGLALGNTPTPVVKSTPVAVPDQQIIVQSKPDQPARTPPVSNAPSAATVKNVTTGGLVVATGVATHQAVAYGIPLLTAGIVGVCALVVIGVIWYAWHQAQKG